MTSTLQSLIIEYTAKGWTFDPSPGGDWNDVGGYYVASPAMAALDPELSFYINQDVPFHYVPEALKGATDREVIEDYLLTSEAMERAERLYGQQVYGAFNAAASRQMEQIVGLLRRGTTPEQEHLTQRSSLVEFNLIRA